MAERVAVRDISNEEGNKLPRSSGGARARWCDGEEPRSCCGAPSTWTSRPSPRSPSPQKTGYLSTMKDTRVGDWVRANNVELAYSPHYASWLNRIEAQFTALRYF